MQPQSVTSGHAIPAMPRPVWDRVRFVSVREPEAGRTSPPGPDRRAVCGRHKIPSSRLPGAIRTRRGASGEAGSKVNACPAPSTAV